MRRVDSQSRLERVDRLLQLAFLQGGIPFGDQGGRARDRHAGQDLAALQARLAKANRSAIAARLAGNKLTEKLEEKLGDKVSPELKDALKGLFNR